MDCAAGDQVLLIFFENIVLSYLWKKNIGFQSQFYSELLDL